MNINKIINDKSNQGKQEYPRVIIEATQQRRPVAAIDTSKKRNFLASH